MFSFFILAFVRACPSVPRNPAGPYNPAMADPTYIACPRCGEPYAMTVMQKRLYHGRTLTCQRCAKPFEVTEDTPDPVPAPSVRPWASAAQSAAAAPTPAKALRP